MYTFDGFGLFPAQALTNPVGGVILRGAMRPLLLALPLILAAALPLRAADVPSAQVALSSSQWSRTTVYQEAYKADPEKAKAFAATSDARVAALCEAAPADCGRAQKLLADIKALEKETPVLTDLGYDPFTVKAHYSRITNLFWGLYLVEGYAGSKLDPLFALLVNATAAYDAAVEAQLTASEQSLSGRLIILESDTKELEDKPLPTQAEVESLTDDQLDAFESFKSLSLGIDAYYEPAAPCTVKHRETANDLALKLAGLRDRLIALQARVGLPPSTVIDLSTTLRSKKLADLLQLTKDKKIGKNLHLPTRGGEADEISPVPSGSPRGWPQGPQPMGPGGPKALPGKNPFPKKKPKVEVTPTSRAGEQAPPMDQGDLDRLALKAKLLRWFGRAEVAGEPKKRALLLHEQNGNTCAVVAQQQLLLAYGAMPGGDQKKLEELLTATATTAGYYDDGTPNKYLGDLLVLYGLIIIKHVDATDAELETAAKTGKMLLVSVDPGILWNKPQYLGSGHAILLTGVEFLRKSGKVLGYYINDSGDGKGEGGRFVPAEQFLKAWHKHGSRFIEVL